MLDGESWFVSIVTKNKEYQFVGSNSYPEKWSEFCQSIEELVGSTFR